MVNINKHKFSLRYKEHTIIGDIMGSEKACNVFLLHGAGKSDRKRYDPIRVKLEECGFSTCSFDFIGHGDTGGDLSSSSLFERTEIASSVIDKYCNGKPLTIIGASMSGYTAVKLLEKYNISKLILLVPAAYDKNAYYLRFNDEFTKCIRKNKSYLNSDAWRILKKFNGKLLIINAEKDRVIPTEVIDLLSNAACLAKCELFTVKNSPHKLLQYLKSNDDQFNILVDKIIKFIS